MLTLFFGSKNDIPLKKNKAVLTVGHFVRSEAGHPVRLKWTMRKTTGFPCHEPAPGCDLERKDGQKLDEKCHDLEDG